MSIIARLSQELSNRIYDWWNAQWLEDQRVAAACIHLRLHGETSGCELRAVVKSHWFGERMNIPQWHAVMKRLESRPDVVLDQRWIKEPHSTALARFYRMRDEVPA